MVLEQLHAVISDARRVLLTGPEDPDGDSIGACLALQRVIGHLSGAVVHVAGDPGFRYRWMARAAEMIPDEDVTGRYDLAVVLDGDQRRLTPPVQRAFQDATRTAIIDHHGTTSADGYDVAWIERHAASTCGMVLEAMDAWGVPLDPDIAGLLYAGIIFDTGGFRYSNTTADTHRKAARLLDAGIDHASIAVRVLMERRRSGMLLQARVLDTATFHGDGAVVQGVVSLATREELGASRGDVEGIVDTMVYVEGVEVAVLLVERGPDRVKLSLRSRGKVNVADVARALNPAGGGHAKAAGVVLEQSLDTARRRLPDVLAAAVRSGS
ncbi:MAG: DHH family phosphoesterase [Alphaproteobacteria bacterium]|nr:DHH family phosphoesterase [Alphaproteobacteria bacterium]